MSQTETGVGAPARGAAPREMRRRVLGLAWPVIGQNLLETMLGIVDTALVARLGASATAGVGSAQQVMFFLLAALSALSIGSAVLVAQAVGVMDTGRARRLARQSLVWAVLLGIPLALAGLSLAYPIIGIFRLEPDVTAVGGQYLQVTMGTAVVLTGLLIGGGVLRGAGDSRTPMVVSGIANVVNAGLAYAMIYGHLGLPAMGPVGSAWATFIARSLALALMVGALWRGRNGVSIRGATGWLPDLSAARQILGIGIPAALEQVLSSAAFFALTLVVAGLGTATLAGNQIAFTALSTSFLPGFGFGIAATTLVGQSVGARRIAEGGAAMRIALRWALIWMSVFAVVLIVFAESIMRAFTADEAVIAAGSAGLRIVALQQPLWGVMLVVSGALRGTGDTRFPLVVGSSTMWAGVLLAALLINVSGRLLGIQPGLALVWGAFLVVSPVAGALYWRRFNRTVAAIERREQADSPADSHAPEMQPAL